MSEPIGMRGIFDPVCGALEDFLNENALQVLKNRKIERTLLWPDLKPFLGRRVGTAPPFLLLQKAFERAENRFAELCKNQGLDDLLAILRRFPAKQQRGQLGYPISR